MCQPETRRFEIQTCTRCGGCGQFSYCQMYGTTCFKCKGKGTTYTKRGYAALLYYVSLCQKRAGDVQPGELVYCDYRKRFFKVERTGWDLTGSYAIVDGVKRFYFQLECVGMSMGFLSEDDLVRVGQSAEEKARKLTMAYDYQDTLTKQGKPRVVRGAKK